MLELNVADPERRKELFWHLRTPLILDRMRRAENFHTYTESVIRVYTRSYPDHKSIFDTCRDLSSARRAMESKDL